MQIKNDCFVGKGTMKTDVQEKIRQLLELLDQESNACYILITCDQPSKDGKMQVNMTYKGESNLAAYLIENAQVFFDQQSTDLAKDF